MQEAEKIIYLTDTRHEDHACISSEPYQMREVCVWIPKHRAEEAHISETLSVSVIGMLNDDKSVAHVDNRWKKMKKTI